MLTPQQNRNLIRIIPFGIIWGVFGFLYVLLEYGLLGDSLVYPSTNNIYSVRTSLFFLHLWSIRYGHVLWCHRSNMVEQAILKETILEKNPI